MSSPEHSGHEAGEKSKKYDRQLRLWGDHGQSALESAKVCLINATATGTEILKNLILPGVGSFTIVDSKKVSGEDVGNNFFLEKDSIGESRAQVATTLLLELNEDVNGDFVDENVEDLLDSNAQFFTRFSVVIATSLPEKVLLKLGSILYDADVPLLVCSSYGLLGYMRIVVKEHTVVESHPDSAHEDLRLDRPFPGLIKYCDSLDLSSMTKKEHGHTPWLAIIYKYLQQWKAQHNGEAPKNYREKNQLKELIREGILRNADNVPEDEENFDEAIKNVNTALVPTKVPETVQQIFNDPCCSEIHSESKPFWVIARAIREFVNNEGQGFLPLRGSIPDMTADSERYIQLQNVYREQSLQDQTLVTAHVYNILQSVGREEGVVRTREHGAQSSPSPQSHDGITETDIKMFCKNAAFIRLQRCRPIQEEYTAQSSKMPQLAFHLEDEDSDLVHYVMFRAVGRFFSEYNRYPGCYQDSAETDIPILRGCVQKLLQEWGLVNNVKDDFVHEYCRYGASEIHSVAAYMGGAAAQEVIKLLTAQFVPINNTHIYNAVKQTSITVEL